jgi:hypothetical protein
VPRLTKTTNLQKFLVSTFLGTLFLATSSGQLLGQTAQPGNVKRDLDLHSYEAELQRISHRIEEIKHQPAEISSFRKSLPESWDVRADNLTLDVSTQPIESALRHLQTNQKNADGTARDLEFRLSELGEAAVELENPSDQFSIATARERLNKVFQRREFGGLKGPSEFQILETRIANWIFRQIARLLQLLHISAKTGDFLAWAVIGLAFLACCYWVYRTISGRRTGAELPQSSPAAASEPKFWLRDALAATDRGDYREAIHLGYWAAIARLEYLKILKRDDSRTPRESLRLLEAHPDTQAHMRELTQHFELIWYGYRPASASDWLGMKTQLEKIGCLKGSIAAIANS